MKKRISVLAVCTLLGCAFPFLVSAQTAPDPALVAAIEAIKAVDNHAHPLRALKPGERDTEWSDLSYHTPETAAADPGAQMPLVSFRLRPKSPEFIAVWQALYRFSRGAVTKEVVQELVQSKQRVLSAIIPGAGYAYAGELATGFISLTVNGAFYRGHADGFSPRSGSDGNSGHA